MFLTINSKKFNIKNVFFDKPIINNILPNSNFVKLSYSTNLFTMNGIYIDINLDFISIKQSLHKLYFFYDIKKNMNNIQYINSIERDILLFASHTITILKYSRKKPIFNINNHLNLSFIKVNDKTDTECKNKTSTKYKIVLKISGIWITENEYGLIYKFIHL